MKPIQTEISSNFIEELGDIFHCGKCNLDFNSLYQFVLHKKSSHPRTLQNEIDKLDSVENSNEALLENLQFLNCQHLTKNVADVGEDKCNTTNDDNNVLICSICKRHYQEQLDLFLHIQSHFKEKPYQCIICARIFSQKSNAKKHMESHKVWPNGLNKTIPNNAVGNNAGYSCPYCNLISTNYSRFKTHLKIHDDQKLYRCIQEKCSSMYTDFNSLISHINNDHKLVQYHCHVCAWTSSSLKIMLEHQQTHSMTITRSSKSEKTYRCLHCRSLFKNQDNLRHHLATADHANVCDHCDKSFLTEKALRRHLILHDKTKFLICDVCKASFARKYHLISHFATHLKNKIYSCSVCNAKFARKDLLVRHAKIHKPDNKRHCPLRERLGCKREFTRNDKLKLHIKSHMRKIQKNNNSELEVFKIGETENCPSTIEIIVIPLSSTE